MARPRWESTEYTDTGYGSSSSDVTNDAPAEYVDLSTYGAVRLVLEYNGDTFAPTLTLGKAVTEGNIFANPEDLYIHIQMGYMANGKFQIEDEDIVTLNMWLSDALGKDINNAGDAWIAGGAHVPGYGVSFSNGDEDGADSTGTLRVFFSLSAKVKGGYQTATASLGIYVASSWYSGTYSTSIELRPASFGSPIYVNNGVTRQIAATADDYILVESSLSDLQIINAFNESEQTDFDISVDRTSGEMHYFLEGIEVFGVMRNAVAYSEGMSVPANGEIILFNDYIPPVDGESNIEVLFPCYVSGNADKINKCRIGKLFGNANAKNRLFVSGNPDFPNCDWHSSARNSSTEEKKEADSNGDFTYFGDMDYCFYGQTDNAIMGYDNVATDKMIVLKSKSKVEPTNYFRTSSLIQAIDASGNAVKGIDGSSLYAESFPLATGNIGAGAMNKNSVINLNGDTLYLSSENTICGLDIAGQVGDSQRISYSRSRFIDPELKELDLSDAVLWTNNEYAFLFADEATYVTHYETFSSEINQYEWFKINVGNVNCAIDINGVIYLGTKDGELFRFENDSFIDSRKIFASVGTTLVGEDKITYNSDFNERLASASAITFKPIAQGLENSLFRKVARVSVVADPNIDVLVDQSKNVLRIVAKNAQGRFDYQRFQELLEELAFGGLFYFDKPDGGEAIVTYGDDTYCAEYYNAVRLVPTSDASPDYEAYDPDGNRVNVAVIQHANLCRVIDEECEVTDLDTENSTFKIRQNGRVLDVILYADQDMLTYSLPSEISIDEIVKSYFIAAPAVLGNVSYRKTIWAWTLSAFKEANDLQVCQATNEENLDDMKEMAFADNVPVGLKLQDLSFLGLDLQKSVVPRKYTYYRPISVPFISFGFRSNKAVNSVLTAVSIIYSTPLLGRGDK